MATTAQQVYPTGDFYQIELPFDYGTPIEFVNESACAGCHLFSNIPQLGEGFRLEVTYKKSGADAPDAFEIRVASNDNGLITTLIDGETKMLLVNRTHDTWYSQPGYFDVIDGNSSEAAAAEAAAVEPSEVVAVEEVAADAPPTVDCDVATPPAAPELSPEPQPVAEPVSPCKTVCACDSDEEVIVLFKGYKITIFADDAGAVQTNVSKV